MLRRTKRQTRWLLIRENGFKKDKSAVGKVDLDQVEKRGSLHLYTLVVLN